MPTFLIILNRLSGAARGAILLVAIVAFVDPEVQGLMFAFMSLVALSAMAELGFSRVIMQVTSHESAHVTLGPRLEVHGEDRVKIRLLGFVRFALRLYVMLVLAAAVLLAVAGSLFFHAQGRMVVFAWLLLCVATAVKLTFEGALAVIEGVNRIAESQRCLLVTQLLSTGMIALFIAGGYGVWALGLGTLIGYTFGIFLVFTRGLSLWLLAVKEGRLDRSKWLPRLWGLQWRYAISWACGFPVLNLAVPVAYKIEGPITAGQLGLTQSICMMLIALCTAAVYARTPNMGNLAARGHYLELNALFGRVGAWAFALYVLCGTVTLAAVYLLPDSISSRVLGVSEFAAVLLAYGGYLVISLQGTFVRAHLIEPYYPLSLIMAAVITIALVVLMPELGLQATLVIIALCYGALFVPISTLIYASVRRSQPVSGPANRVEWPRA